jgi:hypothetical protein
METKQINLKLPLNLLEAADSYAKNFGFRNIQELATESIRQKVFEDNDFDETFSEKEINLIDNLIEKTVKNKKLVSEEELFRSLK